MNKIIILILNIVICCLSFNFANAMTWDDFHNLVLNGSVAELERVLKQDNVSINKVHEDTGANLLTIAVTLGANPEIIQYLIENGADVNAKDKENLSPLFYAIGGAEEKIVELLIKAGADVNDATNSINMSMLDLARVFHGEDSQVYQLMINNSKFAQQSRSASLNSDSNVNLPKINVVVADMNEVNIVDINARNINPDICKAGFGPAIFGESMRIGTVYNNFIAVMRSISSLKMQEALKSISFNYVSQRKEDYRVDIYNKDSDLLFFKFWEEDGDIFWNEGVIASNFLLKSDSNSVRERERIKNEIKAKTKTVEGCFEICKPYAPLIITLSRYTSEPPDIKLSFYYDNENNTFTLLGSVFMPRIFALLGYKMYGLDSFVSSILNFSDLSQDRRKIKDFYKTTFDYYYKDTTNGYAVTVRNESLGCPLTIFPIVDEETLYPVGNIKSELELREEYDKKKSTTLRAVTVKREDLTSYNQLQEVPIPFEKYYKDYQEKMIGDFLWGIGFRKFSESMKLRY